MAARERVNALFCEDLPAVRVEVVFSFSGIGGTEASVSRLDSPGNDEHDEENHKGTGEELVEQDPNEGTSKHYRNHHKYIVQLKYRFMVDAFGHHVRHIGCCGCE